MGLEWRGVFSGIGLGEGDGNWEMGDGYEVIGRRGRRNTDADVK